LIEAALQALLNLLEPARILMMLAGVGIGLCVGLIPGLSGTVGMSLVLPFIFGVDPSSAMALLIGMVAVIHTADTFPSILLGVPGSSGSQATIVDGYPLARQGEASRALSAAFFSSMVGGVIGAFAVFLFLPLARPLVLALGSPELFMLAALGLSMVGVLSGTRPLLGIVAGVLGLVLGTVGAAPAAPHYRFTFEALYLFDGIPLAVIALGLFALPELLDLLVRGRPIASVPRIGSGWMSGLKDVVENRWLVLRSSVLGVGIGIIPGLGGSVVDWLSYGQAVQTSRDRSRFGHGDIRGVIAPESSNNAKEGGTLIPTLIFGIPGSGTTAVLLGGLLLLGLEAGPQMLTANLGVTLLILWTLALANVVGTLACLLPSRFIARLCFVPASRLAPFLLVIMLFGAYQSTRHWGDLVAFGAIGMLGWLMKQNGWPRPPLLIGFVLAAGAERYFWISWTRYGWEWLLRPGVLIIGAVTIVLTVMGARMKSSAVPGGGAL
jgi:putative tricarboxylic transport membrane protein